jgi:hypothetical protein
MYMMNFIQYYKIVDKWMSQGWGGVGSLNKPEKVAKLAFCLEMQDSIHIYNKFLANNCLKMMKKLFNALESQGRLATIPDGPDAEKTFVSGIALPPNSDPQMDWAAQVAHGTACVSKLIDRMEQAGHFQTKIKLCYLTSVVSTPGDTLALMFARE